MMSKRDIGAEILKGIDEIKDFKEGKGSLKVTELSEPSPPQVIRSKLNMSQSAFAALLGVSIRTLQAIVENPEDIDRLLPWNADLPALPVK